MNEKRNARDDRGVHPTLRGKRPHGDGCGWIPDSYDIPDDGHKGARGDAGEDARQGDERIGSQEAVVIGAAVMIALLLLIALFSKVMLWPIQ